MIQLITLNPKPQTSKLLWLDKGGLGDTQVGLAAFMDLRAPPADFPKCPPTLQLEPTRTRSGGSQTQQHIHNPKP